MLYYTNELKLITLLFQISISVVAVIRKAAATVMRPHQIQWLLIGKYKQIQFQDYYQQNYSTIDKEREKELILGTLIYYG